jgi:hypothetical protein
VTAADTEAGNFWDSHVGPFYDADGVLVLLRTTGAALQQMVETDAVLAVTTSDGTLLFPTFQFGPHSKLLPGLQQIAGILRPFSDDNWDIALWLATPVPQFGDRPAADSLHSGDIDIVLSEAQRDASRWGT